MLLLVLTAATVCFRCGGGAKGAIAAGGKVLLTASCVRFDGEERVCERGRGRDRVVGVMMMMMMMRVGR